MDIYVFSNLKNIDKSFAGIKKEKNVSIRILPAGEIKKLTTIAHPGSLIFADISSYKEKEIPRTLKFLAQLESYHHIIIDPNGSAEDIAGLFHNGALDYIDKKLLKSGITLKRLSKVLEFKKIVYETDEQKSAKLNYILSGNNWENIVPGRIYTFCFMYVELDNKDELKCYSTEQFNRIINSFRKYLEELMAPKNGKIWIWSDFGGLILFPFNGKKCDAIETAFMLMINRKLLNAEIMHHDIMLSYRIAMHIGNTVYKTIGETGTIVSDSLNSVFHLGQKFAEPGNFYLTDDVFCMTPGGLMSYFIPAGKYEGRNILRMRRVL